MALTGSNQLFSANHKNKESEIIYEIKWKEELSLIKKQTYCIIPINRRGQTNMVTLNSTTRCETAMENVELWQKQINRNFQFHKISNNWTTTRRHTKKNDHYLRKEIHRNEQTNKKRSDKETSIFNRHYFCITLTYSICLNENRFFESYSNHSLCIYWNEKTHQMNLMCTIKYHS